jgi:RHS repeat-associated protein
MNGVGGLDAVSPYLDLFEPTIADVNGNILGYYDPTQGKVIWTAARVTGYGAVPGREPIPFGSGANLAQASAWRGLPVEGTGYYQIGHRTYDPVSGMWLSHDPIFDDGDPNGFSFTGGDPVNYFDPSGLCLEAGWNGTKYYGGMTARTVVGMAKDINAIDAMVDPINPQYFQVHMQMARQGMVDYANGGQGWSGSLNAFNRVNPLRSPFEAVSGEHLMEGPQLGNRLTGAERATQWANTVTLAASLGAGAPGTMSAVSADLRTMSSFASMPRTFVPGELMPNGQLAGVGPGAMFRGEPPPSVPLYRGVPGNGTQKAILGQQGVAIPRGTALDEASLTKHVLGEDVNAGVTSWTPNRSVAQRFAGPGGTIIEVDWNDVLDQIVPRPNVPKYGAENEVLLKGPVQGTPTIP